MSDWFLAPSLDALRDEVDARWPNRSTVSDGTIGDAAHSARVSQHNPNDDPNDAVPDGAVTAIDITSTNATLRDAVLEAAIGDDRVWYVINRGHIWSRTHGWAKQDYDGSNPHNGHIHISLRQTGSAVKDRSSWGIRKSAPAPKPEPKPEPSEQRIAKLSPRTKPGKRWRQVRVLQRLLIAAGYGPIKGAVTSFYGPQTQAAVARFHNANPHLKSKGVARDVVIGSKGYAELQREAYAKGFVK